MYGGEYAEGKRSNGDGSDVIVRRKEEIEYSGWWKTLIYCGGGRGKKGEGGLRRWNRNEVDSGSEVGREI